MLGMMTVVMSRVRLSFGQADGSDLAGLLVKWWSLDESNTKEPNVLVDLLRFQLFLQQSV